MSFDDSTLDPVPELAVPLLLAIGRLVLGAAALEKILLVDIVTRELHRDGAWRDEFVQELTDLQRRPAGKLLDRLRGLGISDKLAERIGEVIARRNRVVHHLMEDGKVGLAMHTGAGLEEIVADIESIAVECQQIVNQLVVVAFPELEAAIGMTAPELADALASIDPATIADPNVRAQLQAARVLRDALRWEQKPRP